MKENHRQLYLSALGIENYMPRWVLPGAPMSVPCDWEIFSEDEVVALPRSESVPQEHSLQEQVTSTDEAALALDEFQTEAKRAGDRVAKKVTRGAQSAQEILQRRHTPALAARYSLTLWQISDGLLVLDSRQAELALPTEALMQNILRAVNITTQLPKADVLRWPLVDSIAVASDIQQAREHLAAFLSAKLSTVKDCAPSVWILGETAAQYFLPKELKLHEIMGQCIPLASEWFGSIEPQVCVMPSLVAMLQNPSDKRVAWNALTEWKRCCENR